MGDMREERPLSFLHGIAVTAQRLQVLHESDDEDNVPLPNEQWKE
jgi:hypothetical protein